MKKFTEGKGNIVRRTEQLRDLGAVKSKDFDKRLLDRSSDDE
jgi:DNA recombination protein RmuC